LARPELDRGFSIWLETAIGVARQNNANSGNCGAPRCTKVKRILPCLLPCRKASYRHEARQHARHLIINGRGWPPSPALQSLPSGKLDVLRDRQTMPLEVIEDRRRVPHRMTAPVRTDLTAPRKRIVSVALRINFQSLGMRPAIRPAQDILQFPPINVER
jgi:hypothetical protein